MYSARSPSRCFLCVIPTSCEETVPTRIFVFPILCITGPGAVEPSLTSPLREDKGFGVVTAERLPTTLDLYTIECEPVRRVEILPLIEAEGYFYLVAFVSGSRSRAIFLKAILRKNAFIRCFIPPVTLHVVTCTGRYILPLFVTVADCCRSNNGIEIARHTKCIPQ